MNPKRIRNKVIALVLMSVLILGNLCSVTADDQLFDPTLTETGESLTDTGEGTSEISDPEWTEKPGESDILLEDEESEEESSVGEDTELLPDTDPSETDDEDMNNGESLDPSEDDGDVPADEDPDKNADEEDDRLGTDSEEEKDSLEAAKSNDETPKAEVEKTTASGAYTIKVTGFSSAGEFSSMKAYIWSDANGEDDVTEHEMILSEDEQFYSFSSTIADFKNLGKIVVKIVTIDEQNKETQLIRKNFTIQAPTAESVTAIKNSKASSFKVKVVGVTSEYAIKRMKTVVWRGKDKAHSITLQLKKSGEDYVSDEISLNDFGGYSGEYKIRVVAYLKNGNAIRVSETVYDYEKSSGSLSFVDKYAGKSGRMQKVYTLTVRGIAQPAGIEKVEFAVWPKGYNGKVKTYKASYQGNGVYKTNVSIKDFKVGGQYIAQVFVTGKDGSRVSVKRKNVMNVDGTAIGKVSASGRNATAGTFKLNLTKASAPSGVYKVKFTVWTQSTKSDKHVYTATKENNGKFWAKIDIKNHDYNCGKFHVTTTYVMGNGVSVTKDSDDVTFNAKDVFFVTKPQKGTRIAGVVNPSNTNGLKFAVWSKKGGKDDLKWYEPKKQGKKWIAYINIYEHATAGLYYVRGYSGSSLVSKLTFKADQNETEKTGWIYEEYNGEILKFLYIDGVKQTDLRGKVNGPYMIRVNRYCNTITIYAKDGSDGPYNTPVIAFICSCGLGEMTPTGYFKMSTREKWHRFYTWNTWVQYACHYDVGRYFHSVTCGFKSVYGLDPEEFYKLGNKASHGCIRMTVEGAKWIYDHFSLCKQVYIYDSGSPGPFGKPARPNPVQCAQGWYDPTDPAV